MHLVSLHADTVDALKRLSIQLEDLTPNGLWSSKYHLVGLTTDQMEALELFNVTFEDVTPAQLAQGGAQRASRAASPAAAEERRPAQAFQAPQAAHAAPGQGPAADVARPATSVATTPTPATADETGREPMRAAGGNEAEVPLAQVRDGGARAAETRPDAKPDGRAAGNQQPAQGATQKNAGGKGGGVAAPQSGRKGQPPAQAAQGGGVQGGGQRYGTTRLRISVAGKYTEATVANGKIVVAGRSFDSPDQAAAELTKSRGDWTFWEYYDSADGKWRMLTRDWDTVLKSAAPGGR